MKILTLFFWTSLAFTNATASDYRSDNDYRATGNFTWQHWEALGYFQTSLSFDLMDREVDYISVGHYFMGTGTGVYVSAFRAIDDYHPQLSVSQEITSSLRLFGGVRDINIGYAYLGGFSYTNSSLYLNVSYDTSGDKLFASGSYRLNDTTNLFLSAGNDNRGTEVSGGISVFFRTGDPRSYRAKKQKSVEWLNEPGE